MDQVSMSQEEIDFLSGKKHEGADDEMEEGKQALEGVLGSAMPALPAGDEQKGLTDVTEAGPDSDDGGEWLDILGSGALRKKVRTVTVCCFFK